MHETKGLEFRSGSGVRLQRLGTAAAKQIESVSDTSGLEEVYSTERYLLYVACTRASDHLLVTAAEPASEFLDDFGW